MSTLLLIFGYLALIASTFAIVLVAKHWMFFKKSEKSHLAKLMAFLCLSDLVTQVSIWLYNFNLSFFQSEEIRVLLKSVQLVSIVLTAIAIHRLLNYYRNLVEK